MLQEVLKNLLAVVVGGTAVWVALILERNDREAKRIRVQTRKDATQATTQAWVALYQDEKHRHEQDVQSLNAQIKTLKDQCDQYEREIARWHYIGERVKLK